MAISDILNRGRAHKYDEKTVERVLRTAREQEYQPNRAAQALRKNQTRIIGFAARNLNAAGNMANHVVYPFVVGASHALVEADYHLAVVELEELALDPVTQERRLIDDSFYDGLIMQLGATSYLGSTRLSSRPIIWWDGGVFDENDCIYRQERTVSSLLTSELVELGHRKIGYPWTRGAWERYNEFCKTREQLGEKEAFKLHAGVVRHQSAIHFSTVERYEGYLEALKQAGLEPLTIFYHDIYSLGKEIGRQGPSVLFIPGSPDMAPFYQAASIAGKRIPYDLSLANCDVEAKLFGSMDYQPGGMTYDRMEAGRLAGKMILQRVEEPEAKVQSIQLKGDFRLGDTIVRHID